MCKYPRQCKLLIYSPGSPKRGLGYLSKYRLIDELLLGRYFHHQFEIEQPGWRLGCAAISIIVEPKQKKGKVIG